MTGTRCQKKISFVHCIGIETELFSCKISFDDLITVMAVTRLYLKVLYMDHFTLAGK
jgi:hypothetical protein